jgi:Ca2+-binding RTX toxin-like protein
MALINGTSNADSLSGSVDADSINGLQGNDTINGAAGNDTLVGSSGNDRLTGNTGNDLLLGDEGNDSLWGSAGNDFLRGGLGSDRFYPASGGGSDTIDGDFMTRQRWLSRLEVADNDYDYLIYSDSDLGINVNLSSKTVTNPGNTDIDYFSGIEELRGSAKSDTVTGRPSDGNAIYFSGHGGSDFVDQSVYGVPGRWTDGIRVAYWWSDTAIQVTWNQQVATVIYGPGTGTKADSGRAYLGGADTLNNVMFIESTDFDDLIDARLATTNHLGYATATIDNVAYHIIGLRGGNDTVLGNGATIITPVSYTDSNKLLNNVKQGITVNGMSSDAAGLFTVDMRHIVNGSLSYGQLKFSGVSYFFGTDFDDSFVAGGELRSFRGYGGNDSIQGDDQVNRSSYRSANNAIVVNLAAGSVTDSIGSGTSVGNDTLRGIEDIEGTNFDDRFDASGFSKLSTNSGSFSWHGLTNWFEPGGGNDTVIGNGSTRLLYSTSMLPISADLASGFVDALDPAKRIAATNEYLYTLGRTTIISGVNGLSGSDFGDSLVGGGQGGLIGTIRVEGFEGRGGNDTIDGRDGYDVAIYTASPAGIRVDLNRVSGQVTDDGWGSTDTLISIEEIQGSNFNDSLRGNGLDNQFRGGKGFDSIDGGPGYDEATFTQGVIDPETRGVFADLGASSSSLRSASTTALKPALGTSYTGWAIDNWGDIDRLVDIEGLEGSSRGDTLIGSDGSNRIDGRSGDDYLDGGEGTDWAEFNNAEQSVIADLALSLASNDGFGHRDVLFNFENLQGGIYNDSLTGNATANFILGEAGADTLMGGAGNDSLSGGEGNDVLMGGEGYDVAIFEGIKANYQITAQADGTYQVVALADVAQGLDRLSGIERLQFTDQNVDIAAPSAQGLSGVVYHWKSHSLLSGTNLRINDPQAVEPSNSLFDLRAASFDSATGVFTVQIWANSGTPAASLDFSVSSTGANSASFSPTLSAASWSIIANASDPNQLVVGGFKTNPNDTGIAGAVQIGTVRMQYPSNAQSIQLEFKDIAIGTVTSPSISLTLAAKAVGSDGSYAFPSLNSGNYDLSVSRSTGDGASNNGISSADALAALNIAVGLNPNLDPDGSGPLSALKLSPYQIIAADVNGDGRVSSADAYAILEMAVRLPSALTSSWVFLQEKQDLRALSRSSTQIAIDTSISIPNEPEVNWVGLLKGDVNGSWNLAGSQKIEQLQPNYFSRLANLIGVSEDQWGVLTQGVPFGD